MAKVAIRFGCTKQSKNLERYLIYTVPLIVYIVHSISLKCKLALEVFVVIFFFTELDKFFYYPILNCCVYELNYIIIEPVNSIDNSILLIAF